MSLKIKYTLTTFIFISTTRKILESDPPHTIKLVCGTSLPQYNFEACLSGTIVLINLQDP